MRKWMLTVAMAMLVASPAMAAEKKAKKAAKETRPVEQPLQKVDSNEASWRLVKGALPIILPSWSMPLYMQVHGNDAAAEQKKQEEAFKRSQGGQAAAKPARKKKTAASAN
jgi:hypothetical protein